ncbi:MAG: glycosyltransferase family 9 protein, partial [Promethearchaeota archaeon]
DLIFNVSKNDKKFAADFFVQNNLKDSDFVVSLSPVSRQPYKVWPAKNFAFITDWLIREYKAKILFLWGPNENHFVEDVIQNMQMAGETIYDYAIPTLTETKALLEKVDYHFGNDNGIRHFAIAAGTPTFAVFGRPFPENWTPPNQNLHRWIEFDPGCKSDCTYPKCEHLNCINLVDVRKAQHIIKHQIEELKLYEQTT